MRASASTSMSPLHPAIAEAAHRADASAIGLIDLGGANLGVDRVRISYSNGQALGDPSAPVRIECSTRGDRAIPERALPEVLARVAVDQPEDVADAIAGVPADALPVVITTWALSRVSLERRLRFLHALDAGRPVAWVSAEGVGVAPSIPTLGDRRASGHSIVGLALLDRSTVRAEAVGRCWSRGRFLAWLA